MTTRDRNRLALAADAIGAAALGVEAILPLFGDPVPEGVEAKEVRDVDSPGLVALLAELAAGPHADGLELDVPAVVPRSAPPRRRAARRSRTSRTRSTRAPPSSRRRWCSTPMPSRPGSSRIRDAGLCERAAFLPGLVIPRSAALVERLAGFGALVADGVAERAEQGDGLALACELAEQLLAHPRRRRPPPDAARREPRGDGRARRTRPPHRRPKLTTRPSLHTTLSSATKTVTIGHDQPFCIIGERINPTGRKAFAAALREGDLSQVVVDVEAQVAAGAHVLDVNMGVPLTDEPDLLARAIRLVQEHTDLPICIDSSIVEALEAGLDAYEGKALVNSATGEDDRMELILPLVKQHGAAVIALANDETGIPMTVEQRLEITRKIARVAVEEYGIALEDIVIDPLAMPIGADPHDGHDDDRRRSARSTTSSASTCASARRTSASGCRTATR